MAAVGLRRLMAAVAIAGLLGPAGVLGENPPRTDEDARIIHALNRLGYGPRPGDIAAVRATGLLKWMDLQMHPERLSDRSVGPHLTSLRTLSLSSEELMKGYELPPEARKEIQQRTAALGTTASEDQTRMVREQVSRKYRGEMEGNPRQVIEEMQQGKLLRAIYSERQLNEVLVDFWMNHFNVFAEKGQDRYLIDAYERDVIRPRVWGKFEDLLRATAESPAMLFYLDNWLSADPNAPPPGPARRTYRPMPNRPQRAQQQKRGLNENYAREIMELHTLGVDGGYTQKDVTELARCLTGWTIRGLPQQRPTFMFDDRVHDHGDKLVLGQVIHGAGKDEGDFMIHVLAIHPSTAHFICLKLARRFVSDDPPKALVDRAAQTFTRTAGDIRAVVMTILTSQEFFSQESMRAKVKTPLEFVVSAVRASGSGVIDARELAKRIGDMGMPLYLQQPPTGYKDTADAWVSTSGLLARLNFALDLSGGKLRGVRCDPVSLAPNAPDSETLSETLASLFIPSGLSEATHRTLDAEAGAGLNAPRIAGLILGSPEFQRR
jgi:uncharacterized protein (DUF1800 family)